MSTGPRDLRREVDTFARYLIGERVASEALADAYASAHGKLALVARGGIDRWLLDVARLHPFLTRVADAYARRFAPRAAVRRKLILLLAMLESTHPTSEAFEAPGVSAGSVVLRLFAHGMVAVLATLAGLVVFGPLHLVSNLAADR